MQSVYAADPSDLLYRLVDLMEWYINRWDVSKDDNYVLYSEELNRILAYRSVVKWPAYLRRNDVFDLIEAIGDRIETSKDTDSSFAIWKICS